MGRTKNNLVELFFDKAVLAAAGIAALLILFFFVIGSPNAIEYNGLKLSPGKVDRVINEKALQLQMQFKKEPTDSNEYKSQKPAYLALISDSINNIKTQIVFPKASYSTETEGTANRVYRLPSIENISAPTIASVKMAAYVPTEELSGDLTYANADTKLADVDLVTVESSINAKKLYDSFRAAFVGKNMPVEWRNEQYAKPVFAVVELQRRTAQSLGTWSEWETVPRTKICHLKKLLELPKKAAEYEIQLSMVQFAKAEMMYEILQPAVYDNAIPAEPWLCPSLYNDRAKRLKKEDEEKTRLELEAERATRLSERTARSATTTRPPAATRPPTAGTNTDTRTGGTPAPAVTTTKPQPTKQPAGRTAAARTGAATTELGLFNELRLAEKSKPELMEKLVFWANDDTAKPGEKYQYRMRIGVFNPIAGTNWLGEEQKDLQDKAVLYSNFSEPTGTVEIDESLKFFATEIRELQKGNAVDKTIEVKVARYTLGNWVTKVFSVKKGEQIGTVVDAAETRLAKVGVEIDTVDFSTGAVVIDSRRVSEWLGAGVLRQRDFDELMYSRGGGLIQTMPIRERYWPDDVVKVYKEIGQAETAEPVSLLTREQTRSGSGAASQGRESPGRASNPGMPDEMVSPGGTPGRERY